VRQYGNLSFSRVFDAGHQGISLSSPPRAAAADSSRFPVPYYQPETAYRIFQRAMFNTDVATGRIPTDAAANYTTTGPSSSFGIKNAVPSLPLPLCYTWDVMETCTDAQKLLLQNGSAVVQDFIVVG
jgi:hypothetical protein